MVVLSGYPIARQLSGSLSISILCRPAKEAAVGAIGCMVTSTPFLEDQSTPASWNPTTPCWTPGSEEASCTSPVVADAVGRYNKAMVTIVNPITQEQVEREPLKYQLKTPFQNLSDGEKLKVVKKAKEDCLHVCNVIAPGNERSSSSQ